MNSCLLLFLLLLLVITLTRIIQSEFTQEQQTSYCDVNSNIQLSSEIGSIPITGCVGTSLLPLLPGSETIPYLGCVNNYCTSLIGSFGLTLCQGTRSGEFLFVEGCLHAESSNCVIIDNNPTQGSTSYGFCACRNYPEGPNCLVASSKAACSVTDPTTCPPDYCITADCTGGGK
jgi:hypothetical protein